MYEELGSCYGFFDKVGDTISYIKSDYIKFTKEYSYDRIEFLNNQYKFILENSSTSFSIWDEQIKERNDMNNKLIRLFLAVDKALSDLNVNLYRLFIIESNHRQEESNLRYKFKVERDEIKSIYNKIKIYVDPEEIDTLKNFNNFLQKTSETVRIKEVEKSLLGDFVLTSSGEHENDMTSMRTIVGK